jgi:lipoic acid synthetase
MAGKRTDALREKESGTQIKDRIGSLLLKPICITVQCPNQCKCISQGTATFSIMGDICTRNCGYCAFPQGKPLPLDPDEPEKVAQSAKQLNLKHVVVTSVNRDDLPDGGVSHFARVVMAIHDRLPDTAVEILIHDFNGNDDSLKIIAESSPEVISHNIDIVPRLYDEVNAGADYKRSLHILELINSWNPDIVTKSGLMLGIGENDYEVIKVMKDIVDTGCNCITLRQYLPPSTRHHELIRYIPTQEFDEYQSLSLQMGYSSARSGPFVRSSFDAHEMYKEIAQ